jgi:hypothetical protein
VESRSLDYLPAADGANLRPSARFSRWHGRVALALWLAFTVLTFLIVSGGSAGSAGRPLVVAKTTAGTVLGPMTGAISRNFQRCCLRFSLSLLPMCAAGLLVAFAVQLLVPPRGRWSRFLRMTAWTAGLFVWFAGGIVSFGHALG